LLARAKVFFEGLSFSKNPKNLLVSEFALLGLAFVLSSVNRVSLFYGGFTALIGVSLIGYSLGYSRPGKADAGDVSGPWRFVRHPETTGRFLLVFGLLIVSKSPEVFVVAVLLLGHQYRELVKSRDKEMQVWLGPKYEIYRAFVPSIMPHFVPVRLPKHRVALTYGHERWNAKKAWGHRRAMTVGLTGILILSWYLYCVKFELTGYWIRFGAVIPLAICFFFMQKRIDKSQWL